MRTLRNGFFRWLLRPLGLILLTAIWIQVCPARQESAGQKTIVVGFVGGVLRHDDTRRSEVQLAARLRAEYGAAVAAEVFEHTRSSRAYQFVLRELAATPGTPPTEREKARARIILYGHSWGASEAVALAKRLQKAGIPVLLTAQVDSVQKAGERDSVIPANVAEAINFFQRDGAIRGRPRIRAADPQRTRILGNIRMDYVAHPVSCPEYPWYEMTVTKSHSEIECDPAVWGQIERLIREKLQAGAAEPEESGQ